MAESVQQEHGAAGETVNVRGDQGASGEFKLLSLNKEALTANCQGCLFKQREMSNIVHPRTHTHTRARARAHKDKEGEILLEMNHSAYISAPLRFLASTIISCNSTDTSSERHGWWGESGGVGGGVEAGQFNKYNNPRG